MAYLKSTNIDGDLSIGGLTLDGLFYGVDNLDYYLGPAVNISANSDLNDYTRSGSYRVISAAIAETIGNTPRTTSGYKLFVINYTSQDYATQIAIASTYTWIRRLAPSDGWTAWERIITANVDDKGSQYYARNNLGVWDTLWSGTWNSGSITVPNIDKYHLYFIYTVSRTSGAAMGTVIIVARMGQWLRGMGGYNTDTPAFEHYYFNAQSTDSWQSVTFIECAHQRNDGSATSYLTVTQIIGIV